MSYRATRVVAHIPFDATVHPTVRIRQTTFVDIRPVSRICQACGFRWHEHTAKQWDACQSALEAVA
jgi:hypothetical protein